MNYSSIIRQISRCNAPKNILTKNTVNLSQNTFPKYQIAQISTQFTQNYCKKAEKKALYEPTPADKFGELVQKEVDERQEIGEESLNFPGSLESVKERGYEVTDGEEGFSLISGILDGIKITISFKDHEGLQSGDESDRESASDVDYKKGHSDQSYSEEDYDGDDSDFPDSQEDDEEIEFKDEEYALQKGVQGPKIDMIINLSKGEGENQTELKFIAVANETSFGIETLIDLKTGTTTDFVVYSSAIQEGIYDYLGYLGIDAKMCDVMFDKLAANENRKVVSTLGAFSKLLEPQEKQKKKSDLM